MPEAITSGAPMVLKNVSSGRQWSTGPSNGHTPQPLRLRLWLWAPPKEAWELVGAQTGA
jgi:hypothetical protein